jgi:hypothetical protein
VRRDLLKGARSWPALERWRCTWVDDIRARSRLHAARLEHGDTGWPLAQQSAAFAQSQRAGETPLRQRPERCAAHRQESALPLAKQQGLRSLPNHWYGLTVCVKRPAVAMDNHTAERVLRPPIVGRKHSDGSGSVWSAHVAAMLLRVLHTVLLGGAIPTSGGTPSSQPVRPVMASARRTSAPSCPGRGPPRAEKHGRDRCRCRGFPWPGPPNREKHRKQPTPPHA